MPSFPDSEAFRHRLRNACLDELGKPVSFLVGSGLSIGAIPGTSGMVEYMRKAVSRDEEDLHDFEKMLVAADPARQYQQAAEFVLSRHNIGRLNRTIRLAVLSARTPPLPDESALRLISDEAELQRLNMSYNQWAMPQGMKAIGQILRLLPPEVRGPILTTNFDPLLEASIGLSGLTPFTVAADYDGSFQTGITQSGDVVQIIHLHGFWSAGDTLHTVSQLESDRPKLFGSLQHVLSDCTCVVMGYGGWDDVLTRSILDLVKKGDQRELDVIWASYSREPSLGVIEGNTYPGRLQPYVGVDANVVLPATVKAIQTRVGGPTKAQVATLTVAGFETVDSNLVAIYSGRIEDPSAQERFYDGREPTWLDIVKGRAPVLSQAANVLETIEGGLGSFSAVYLEGPTGEGKSTCMKQVALALSKRDDADVLFLLPGSSFTPKQILDLPGRARTIYVFIDDADLHIPQISEILSALEISGLTDKRLVLAARDTDWNRSTARFGRIASHHFLKKSLSGLTPDDAKAVVEAWKESSSSNGGASATLSSADWSNRLYENSLDGGHSSLLGAMLATRYGADLQDHVGRLMERLSRWHLPGDSGRTLLDCFYTVCLMSTYGLGPISIDTLSLYVSLSADECERLVVRRLGKEAATHRHGSMLAPRHRMIARTAVELADRFQLAPHQTFSELIRLTIGGSKGTNWDEDVVAIAYSGQKFDNLDLARMAVDMSASADPDQLRLISAQIGVYRKFRLFHEASALCSSAWSSRGRFNDFHLAARGFLREWARVQGPLQRWRDSAALNACALLSDAEMMELEWDDASRAMSGLALSAQRIYGVDGDTWRVRQIVLAEEAIRICNVIEVRDQAQRVLEVADRHKPISVIHDDERAQHIRESIEAAILSSTIAPAQSARNNMGATAPLLTMLNLKG